MARFRLRTLFGLFVPAAITFLLIRDPVPINIVLTALAWIFGLAIALRPAIFIPRRTYSYGFSLLLMLGGGASFGGSALFAFAHAHDAISRSEDWFPAAFFGGLLFLVGGLVMLLGQRND